MICDECETVAHCMKNRCVPKTTKKDEALKLALEALEYASTGNRRPELITPAIIALRQAIDQAEQAQPVAWVGLSDAELAGFEKVDVILVRHFEQILFGRNTQPCLDGLPEPIRTPPEKGTTYWTIGLGKWTWGGTTHDHSCLRNGIWLRESDVWQVHAAVRRAAGLGKEPAFTPPRQPLTDEQIGALLGPFPKYASEWGDGDFYQFARVIEAAHGIKGEA